MEIELLSSLDMGVPYIDESDGPIWSGKTFILYIIYTHKKPL